MALASLVSRLSNPCFGKDPRGKRNSLMLIYYPLGSQILLRVLCTAVSISLLRHGRNKYDQRHLLRKENRSALKRAFEPFLIWVTCSILPNMFRGAVVSSIFRTIVPSWLAEREAGVCTLLRLHRLAMRWLTSQFRDMGENKRGLDIIMDC